MTMAKVSEFVTFLSNKNHPLSAILAHLTFVTFRDLQCEFIALFELNGSNQYHAVESLGAPELTLEELATSYSINDHYPISDSLKSGEIILLTDSEKYLEEYPLLREISLPLNGKSIFAIPILLSATPVAAFGIFCNSNSKLEDSDFDFLRAISDIFSFSVYGARDFSAVNRKIENDIPHLKANDSEDLSPRQVLISRLISEGRTNHDISELIGYSESTVRQEIMKVFVLTNSSSRRQVGEHYQARQKGKQKEVV